jgi:hypothetical protein
MDFSNDILFKTKLALEKNPEIDFLLDDDFFGLSSFAVSIYWRLDWYLWRFASTG